MRGDWKMVVDQLAWRLHNEDHEGAAKLLFTFLVDNADALDSDLDKVRVICRVHMQSNGLPRERIIALSTS